VKSAEAISLPLETDLETLTTLLSEAGDAVAVLSNDGVIEHANATLAARFEVPRERLRGRKLMEATPEASIATHKDLWLRAVRSRERVQWTSSERGRVWRDTLVPNPAGRLLFYGRDITDQSRAENAAEALDARFHDVAERFGFGIAWFTESGLAYANSAFLQIFGCAAESLAFPLPVAAISKVLHPDDREVVGHHWKPTTGRRAIRRAIDRTTVRLLQPGRDALLVDVTSQNIELPTTSGVLVSANDISDRQALFQRLLREEKEESLIAIAGGLAHDFNSILVGILSSVGMLQDEVEASRPALELCDIISSAARRMADMTGQLLMYSRGAPFRPADIDCHQVILDVLKMVRSGVPATVALEPDFTSDRVIVRGDNSQLRQLVMTLVVNALEATESAGAKVSIRTRLDGDQVRIEVRDDGVGMSDEVKERLFDPFFSTKFQGRGLGLAAARGIIEAHGGDVEVESALGKGSTFSIVLPLSPASVAEAPPLRLALFDPDPLIGRMTERLLRRSCYQLDAFHDEAAFEAHIRNNAGELAALIVDRTTGARIVQWLEAHLDRPPVVWLEEPPSRRTAKVVLDDRGDACVEKPFDGGSLTRALSEALSARRPA